MKITNRVLLLIALVSILLLGCIQTPQQTPAQPPVPNAIPPAQAPAQPPQPPAPQSSITIVTNATEPATPNATQASEPAGPFGSMLAYNINDGMAGTPGTPMGKPGLIDTLQSGGWSEFRKDSSNIRTLNGNLERTFQERSAAVNQAGMPIDREIAGYFTWNVVEPKKGQFDWELTDLMMKSAGESGVQVTAVVQPFAAWDQQNTRADPGCKALDFAYYDYRAGPAADSGEYKTFLTKLVERYDADGKDDMPGLKTKVAYWEIGNEVEGMCGGYQGRSQQYVEILKISYETIKKADPNAKVLNGGALEISGNADSEATKAFWRKFFELGGGQYIDYFNFHYNSERFGAAAESAAFLEHFTFFNGLMDLHGGRKPFWITEFGTYSGTPSQPPMPQAPAGPQGQPQPGAVQPKLQSFTTQSPEFQSSWYFERSVIAFANGADRLFIDFMGGDDNPIGASSLSDLQGRPRPFASTLKLVGSKLAGFSEVRKIADGQYRFVVSGSPVYALWRGAVPSEITGHVRITGFDGTIAEKDASQIVITADKPIFVEPAPQTP